MSGGMLNETAVVQQAGKDAIEDFLRRKTLYDVMRTSGKVVVFDTNIPIQLAFYALLEHDLPSAPLWDSANRRFVGLMSVTDFIDILRHYHRRGIPMDELSARTISEVMSDTEGGRPLQHSVFLGTLVTTDIYTAVKTMAANKHRFLPMIPPGESRVLSILSYHDVLRFLVDHFREQVGFALCASSRLFSGLTLCCLCSVSFFFFFTSAEAF
jgi:CBS domain-containing protein